MKKKRIVTDYLFSTPSFLIGAGSVLNLFGNYFIFNTSENPQEADRIALYSDFSVVGQDLQSAMDVFDEAEFPLPNIGE